ncbi:MAG: ABC transporter ATP-binding protein [Fibrella sp.]|nr:ABC transporter ATP-binding protein [Armatimonadota bacterium]
MSFAARTETKPEPAASESPGSILGLLKDRTFLGFLAIVRQYKGLYAISLFAQFVGIGLGLLFADTSRRLFDAAPKVPPALLTQLLWIFAGIVVARLGVTFVISWIQSLLNESVVYQMRRNVVKHLVDQPLSFHENNHSSSAFTVIYNELERAKDFVVSDIQSLIGMPISFITAGLYLLTVHPLLGVIALVVGPLQLLSNLVQKKRFQETVELQRTVSRQVFHQIGESLHGVREVKSNQLETIVDERMGDIQKRGVAYNVQLTQVRSLRGLAKSLPSELGYVVGVGFGAVLMANGQIGPGGLVAFISLLDKVSVPFTSMVGIINNLQQILAGSRHLFEVMATPGEDRTTGAELTLSPEQGPELVFENVSFGYAPEKKTLDDISFTLPAGASLALVGPSGAGKSTLIKLLYRFYEPDSGTIRLVGRPLGEYNVDSVRRNMALVSQDIFLFDGTVRENIVLGRPDATDEEVERAARLAQADTFIRELEKGYDAEIGERGIKLSHGQKQRLSIARAILRNASLLVLDEPTSALDVETEASFQRDLGEWAAHCTKIIIAHRLTTIRDADYVLFLENGRVVEFGTPGELLRSPDSRFAGYWERQGVLAFK